MKFSMNGWRKSFSEDAEQLREFALQIVNDDSFDKDDFIDSVNNIIRHSNTINCVFADGNPDFSNLENIKIPIITDEMLEENGGAA